jgi:predicted transcriptional regulator
MTEADRIRVSDDLVGVTTDLVSAMVRSKMVSKERLADYVRDIHSALIDISFDSRAIIHKLEGTVGTVSPAPQPTERKLPSPDSIKAAVDQLLDRSSSTVFEPAVPYQVRVPQTSPRPAPRPQPPEAKTLPQPAKKVAKAEEKPAPQPSVQPVQSVLPLEETAPTAKQWSGEERRARPIKAKTKQIFDTALPPRLSSIEEAVTLEYIVCLEDGRKVKDLAEHLAKIGVTVDAYREKWKLPAEYPMMAPNAIAKRAEVYEIDLVTGKIGKSR